MKRNRNCKTVDWSMSQVIAYNTMIKRCLCIINYAIFYGFVFCSAIYIKYKSNVTVKRYRL